MQHSQSINFLRCLARIADVLKKNIPCTLQDTKANCVQHLHWTCTADAHFVVAAELNVAAGVQNALLRHVLESHFILSQHQSSNLTLRFGLVIGQMVVALVGRAVTFTAKMGNVFVLVDAFAAK